RRPLVSAPLVRTKVPRLWAARAGGRGYAVTLRRCALLTTPRAYCVGAFVVSGPGTGVQPPLAQPGPNRRRRNRQSNRGGDPWLDRTRSTPLLISRINSAVPLLRS